MTAAVSIESLGLIFVAFGLLLLAAGYFWCRHESFKELHRMRQSVTYSHPIDVDIRLFTKDGTPLNGPWDYSKDGSDL